jgi:hypothetical protein
LSLGESPKAQFSPRLQFEFRPTKIVVALVRWAPKIGKSHRVQIQSVGRQQCVASVGIILKANVVNLLVYRFLFLFGTIHRTFGQTRPFYRVLRSTPIETFPDSFQKFR